MSLEKVSESSTSGAALLMLSSVALLLEAIALIVLSRKRSQQFGSLRCSLITLTSVEMWLNFSIFIHTVWEKFVSVNNETLSQYVCSFFLFCLLNNAICSRNWAVALIALARCEAITRPLAHRVATRIFSPNRQLMYMGFFICIGMFVSVFRLIFQNLNVCVNQRYIVYITIMEKTAIQIFAERLFFVYQSAIPTSLLSLTAIFMTFTLLRHRNSLIRKSSNYDEKRNSNNKACDESENGRIICRLRKKKQAKRISKHVRATRAILLIVIVFTILEAPIFFAVTFSFYISELWRFLIYKMLRYLIVADTYANFVIYLLTSQPFRVELRFLLRCKHSQLQQCPTRCQRASSFIEKRENDTSNNFGIDLSSADTFSVVKVPISQKSQICKNHPSCVQLKQVHMITKLWTDFFTTMYFNVFHESTSME